MMRWCGDLSGAAFRRSGENAAREQKMPFVDGH